ncbi:hypothetical protein V2J09_009242 [Rumex salicifolius]
MLPSTQVEDREVSTYNLQLPSKWLHWSHCLKSSLESSNASKFVLLFVTMFSTALVIGDGILTPSISVLSAVGGIQLATPAMTEDRVVWITIAILIILFSFQRFGTDKVGYSFAPIVCTWFFLNAGIGLYNFITYDPTVIKALNPTYIIKYFSRNGIDAWVSLGGVVLCITGTEAMFADLAHFSVRSIQISICSMVYPALMLTYAGQASYLRSFPEDVSKTFYKAIPGPMYWPMFVVAVMASIIASQAMISGTFSIIQQSLSFGCFPRVTVVHTSVKYEGQIYIPELNYFLMISCVCVTLAFRTTEKIGHAYGIAVVFAETITSAFMLLVMILIWKKHIAYAIAYVAIIYSVEFLYLSSVLYKFPQGGYLPFALACFFMLIMTVWNYVYRNRYYYEMNHKVSPDQLMDLTNRPSVSRIPGLAIFYSELAHGIPPIFEHYAANIPALHSVLVFVSFKSLPISKVPPEERFLFRRVQSKEDYYVFRCVVRYGYTDLRNLQEPFERVLVGCITDFVRNESFVRMLKNSKKNDDIVADDDSGDEIIGNEEVRRLEGAEEKRQREVEAEVEAVERASKAGIVHLMGEGEVIAAKGAPVWKRILIDYGYSFMRKNLKQSDKVLDIPRKRLLKVGMIYEL